MWLACWANVRTPLNSPLEGAKLNLSAGIASTSGTTSRSAPRNAPSSVLLRAAESAANAPVKVKTNSDADRIADLILTSCLLDEVASITVAFPRGPCRVLADLPGCCKDERRRADSRAGTTPGCGVRLSA